MTSGFFDPPCPQFHTTSLNSLHYFVCLSTSLTTPPPAPSSADIITGSFLGVADYADAVRCPMATTELETQQL